MLRCGSKGDSGCLAGLIPSARIGPAVARLRSASSAVMACITAWINGPDRLKARQPQQSEGSRSQGGHQSNVIALVAVGTLVSGHTSPAAHLTSA